MNFFWYLIFSFFLLGVFYFLIFFFSAYTLNSFSDKGSSFECGFQSSCSSSVSFSVPFFMVSLMFLLFDVEIVLLGFYPFSGFIVSLPSFFFLIFLVLFSTVYEWMKGVLSWI